jgi:hypothetical protein
MQRWCPSLELAGEALKKGRNPGRQKCDGRKEGVTKKVEKGRKVGRMANEGW